MGDYCAFVLTLLFSSPFRGGITQTVTGNHFTSVQFPLFTVTLVCVQFNTFHEAVPQLCTVVSNTQMLCPVPDLVTFPNNPPCINLRRRRSADDVTGRVRRQINNIYDRQFYVGLILDGVPTYRNVSLALGLLTCQNINKMCKLFVLIVYL